MKLIKQALLGSLSFFCLYSAIGQNAATRPLQKGDTLPDLGVNISVGDQTRVARLSEFKGKLVILDFWAIYCLDCIVGMKEMLRLQKEFGDKIQIILVTSNSEKQIQELWSKWKKGPILDSLRDAANQLMFIKQDSILKYIFPHSYLPVHVWIDSNQVFKNITYSTTTDAENISKVLKAEPVELDELEHREVDLNDPFSWNASEKINSSSILSYSFMQDYTECGGCSSIIISTIEDTITGKISGVWAFNKAIIDLYRFAYGNEMTMRPTIPFNRMILNTRSKKRLLYPTKANQWTKWLKANSYSYALKVPETLSDNIYNIMRADLDRSLNFRSRIEKRKMKCLLLKEVSSIDKIRSKPGQPEYDFHDGSLRIRNYKMEQLYLYISGIIEKNYPGTLCFDETKFKGNIDFELPWNEGKVSFEELRKALRNYGLDLVYGYKDIDMLVIEDPK